MTNPPAPEMRAVYTQTLLQLAQQDERIVVLEADLMRATGTRPFQEALPPRAFNVGVAEANLVSVAAGLSTTGKIPFASTFACFAARRAFDQFFISANYARLNVKLVGTDPGVTAAYNGGTHMTFEDLGLMRTVPGLVVLEPCDPVSLAELVRQCAAHPGCTYMRLHRGVTPQVHPDGNRLKLGKGVVLRDGADLALLAAGAVMVNEALGAADLLAHDGLSAAVIDMHTIKPIDAELVSAYAARTGALITCENHQVTNGLGSAVAEVLAEHRPTRLRRVGIQDEFGEVGPLDYLKQRFGLTAEHIRQQALDLLSAKNGR